MLTEDSAKVVEVRPGRRLFIRKVLIGSTKSVEPALQLICVHGTCATERQYQPLLESLDRRFEHEKVVCLLFDCIGCGQSPSLKEWDAYSNSEVRADLEAVIQNHSNPTLPTILMGHSYAPSIFLPLLTERPNLLPHWLGCILTSTAVRSDHLHQRDGGHLVMSLPVVLLRCLQKPLTEGFLQMAVHPDHVKLKDVIRTESNSNDMAVAQAYHRQMV